MKKITLIIAALAAAAFLAACSSTPTKEQAAAGVEERTPQSAAGAAGGAAPQPETSPKVIAIERKPAVTPTTPAAPSAPAAASANPLKDPGNILSKRSIYFDYDSSIVKDEFKPLVTAHANYLKQNRSAKVTIQGNTDERGSREYNLALGQRRADSVKQMMTLLGVPEAQIESVSFGEEKPRADGKDEKSYAENRRDDVVYQGE